MWEGLSLPHDTKFGNCRGDIVDRRMILIWSLIHGSGWTGLIKVDPGRFKGKVLQLPWQDVDLTGFDFILDVVSHSKLADNGHI